MSEYEFTLAIEGDLDYETLDALYEAGCDDADFVGEHSPVYATFSREASSFFDAAMSAIRQIESIGRGLRVVALDADDLVTMAEIAERLGRSREGIRLIIAGQRPPGGFPAPALRLRDRTKLWLWSEVAEWARTALHQEVDPGPAPVAPTLNAALRLRRGEGRLSPSEREQLLEFIAS